MVWFIMIWLILIVLYGLDVNPGNSHQSSSDPGLVRVATRTFLCLRCCQIRAAWRHFTLPFQLGQGDGTGEPQLLVGSSEASKASTNVAVLGEPLWFCSMLVDALLAYVLPAKSWGSPCSTIHLVPAERVV